MNQTKNSPPLQNKSSKKSSPRFSLRIRITIYLFAFVLIVIGILWTVQSVFLEKIYMWIKTDELYDNSDTIAEYITGDDYHKNVSRIALDNKICIFACNADTFGELLTVEALEGECDLHKLVYRRAAMGFELNTDNLALISSYAQKNSGEVLLNVSSNGIHTKELTISAELKRSDGEQSVIIARIIPHENGDILLLFNAVISPLVTTVNTLNTMLIYISLLLVFLAVVFSIIIAYLVAKPIRDINNSAKELAKGNYGVSFEGGGFCEVSELSDTLNYAARELSKVDRLKTELISNISHDLRTPLTMISGYAEMMRDIEGEMSVENLQIIIDESDRMKSLVNDVLDVSKLQSGNVEYNMTQFDLTECIEQEIVRYNKLRDHEGYTVKFDYTSPVIVLGDRTRLVQVLYNLLNNAVTHTGSDNTVYVRQDFVNNGVRISVRDSGEGIPPEHLPLIWDRYYKVEGKHKRASKGSGLGLSIVKTIIEAHKGRCGVESSQNGGSTFWFELDIAG